LGLEGDSCYLDSSVKRWASSPTRRAAMDAHRLYEDRGGPLHVVVLAGCYLALFESRFKVTWRGNLLNLDKAMKLLMKQAGDSSLKVVKLVMGNQFDWVEGDRLHFMTGASTFSRFIAPNLIKRSGGEQAEWSATRGKAGARKEQL
jgi:hypothetical protein